MNAQLDRFNNGFNSQAVKDIEKLNKEIEKEVDKEKLTELYIKRMCRGFDINAGAIGRVRGGYYPY
jgi:hypothetical protein